VNWFAAVAAVVVAITTTTTTTTIKAHTRILCVLGTTVDSSTAKPGDEFILRVNDDGQPALYGAVIQGHITRVTSQHGIEPAEIAFLFDTITFLNHTSAPFRGFVVSANVVQHTTRTPGAVPPPNVPGPPASSIVWETQLGPKNTPAGQTGGIAYASSSGRPLVAKAGSPVTIELASDLQTP